MDSSRYNPIYCQWNAPYSSHPPPAHVLPPPPPLPPPPRPSHPESPNLFGRLSQIGGQHQDYHHYSHRQDLPREPAVNQTQPSSYYSQQPQPQPQSHQQHLQYIPQQVTYETQRISEPSSAIQCTESRDIAQSAWVGYKEKLHDLWTVDAGQGRRDAGRSRVDPGTDRNHQYGYGRSARDSSGVSIDRGLDGTSRSRDEFLRLGYERKQSAATRIEGNCQDRGQLKSQSGRYFRGLGEGNRVSAPSVGYGSDRRGVTVSRDVSRSSAPYDGARNQRWDEAGRTFYPRKKDNYYHSEMEQCFDRGRKEESNELNPTPKKQMQKKSALLRLETPRSYQNSRENDRSRYHSYYCKRKFNTNSFKGKEYLGLSDHGFVEKQRGRTPMDLDVTFKSNVLVAKPVASPTSGGICSDIFVTPRSSKARRALVTDKNEKYSVTEGNGKLRTHFSDEVSVSEGSRQSTRQKIASEIEKKPDSHSNPSSSDSGGKLKKIKVVDNVIQDIKVKITDTGYQASIHDSEAKVHSSVHAAEKMFCEALKEAKDDFNVAQDSNMETCSIEEDVIDGDRIILKSHEDMFDRKGTGCNAGEALVPKVPEKEEIVNTPASWPTATYISRCSEGGIHFVGKSMWSVVSLPYEDEDMDCIPSPMMEVNIGSEERKSIGSSIGSLGYREKDFEKSSLDATTYFNSEEPGDQVFAKSYIGVSGGGNNGINKNVHFLAPENDTHSKGLVPISSLDVAYVSTDFANANSSVSGHLGNASNIVSGDLGNANSTVSEDLGNANSTVAGDLANANSTVSGDLANANSNVSGDLANANSTVAGDLANANSTVSGDLANANSFPVGICTKTIVKSPDTSVVFEVENKNTQCENVNPSVKNENFGRKEFMETTSLYSAAETADNLYSDESKQTFVNGTSSSLTKVAVKGSSTVLPMERIDGCSRGDELDLAMAVPSEVCMEIVSTERLLPDEDPGLGSPHSAKIPHVHHQSSGLDSRDLKACLLEPNVSLSKDITYCASECLVKRDVSQNAYSFIDKLPSALGTNGMSCKETTTDAEAGLHETQPCSAVCKLLSEDHFECGSSGAVGSLRNHSLDINLEKGPSGVSSCLVSDCSVSPCQVSPLVTVNEQIQNKTSIQSSCSDSQASIMQKENNSAEKTKVDIQEEKIKPSSGTSEYRTLGIDAIAVSRESVFPCDSLSSSPSLSFRKIQSDLHVAAMVGETSQGKEKPKPTGGTSKYRALGTDIVTVRGDSVFPCDSLSKSPRQIRSEIHVASMVDETCKYKEKTKPSGGTSNYRIPETDSVAVSRGSVFTCDSLSSSPRLSIRKIRSEIHAAAVVDDSSKINGSQKGGSLLQEQIMTSCDVTQAGSSLAHYPYLGQTCLGTDVGSYVRPMSEYHGRYLVEKPNGYPIEKLTDITSDVGSQEKYSPDSAKTDIFEGEALSSDGKVSGTEIPGGSGVRVSRSHSHTDFQFALNQGKDHVVSVRHGDSQSKTSLSTRHDIEKRKEKSNHSTQKIYHRSLPFVSDTKKDANPPTHITKRHTWHRKSDTSPCPFVPAKPMSSILSTEQKLPKVTAQPSSSYVRKGNSLLRKPLHDSPGVALGMPPSASQLNRLTAEDKSTRSASMVDIDNISFHVKTGEMLTLERQSKPHSDSSTSKISNAIATSGKCVLSYSMDHLATGLPESIMDSATSGEANVPHCGGDTFKTSDTLIQTGYASDCQQKSNPLKLDSANLKRMIYVKRKANQLVAASDMYGASKSHIPPSDGYFKRSKNQLVRNLESHVTQSISLPDDVLDSRAAANMVSERSSSSAFSDSAVMRPFKQSKFSLVWTQNDPQPRMPIAHMRYQKILPQLVPWKRVTYWRRLMNSVSAFRNGSFFNISRKLSMMRKRHTVYTRSTNGYSLRKSKVLSIGGSHLKWSKSIERDSQKANEEATLAVAAFTKKEREKHSGQSNTRKTSRNHLARERVFRFGSLRYKMDSSRRTLQRISDVDSRCSGPSKNGKGAKRPFIPKRLMIGNEEYVRVGNGNQLVRDPKKRIRVLANEKVRWSLHNVRLRLAKKKKYCQFFTRFGKCYKDDGKCPYVHDPSKIAVCTKFLNGSCVNENCKLTHKVIPERMPDCSYFLQGLCNNEKCPYRHVHVNPSAAICDGFLKGYCSDGDECRKKHSYTCPVFEATGSCSQGTKCKYHHPKNQSKGRKKKRPSEPSEKNACGRYFSSLHKVLSESEPMIVNRRSTDGEVFGMEGLDFIVLGDTEYEASDNNNPATKQSICSDSEAPVSIYNLIRPVALMQ